jgi:hypothetical protein
LRKTNIEQAWPVFFHFVENSAHWAHMPRMSLRSLFAMMVAMSMLLAPFVMQSSSAMAAMPADHHAQMMSNGHCDEQPSGQDSKSADMPCCAAMCAAIAIAPVSPADPVGFARLVERPSLKRSLHSFLAKLPTPPPRLA